MNHAALIDALRPFAALAERWPKGTPDGTVVLAREGAAVTFGDLRQAAVFVQTDEDVARSGVRDAGEQAWQALAREGRHMDAIKACRAAGGLGLREAWGVVEGYLGRTIGHQAR